jgi:DNA-binding Lrp family transcriptional regulator
MSRQVSGQGQAILIPILLDDVEIPHLLRDVVYLDLRDGDVDRAAGQLIEAVSNRWTRDRTAQQGVVLPRGGRIRAFANLTLNRSASAEHVEQKLKTFPEVTEVSRTYGSVDLVVVLAAEDLQRINVIKEAIANISGVTSTSILIGTV